MMELLRRALSEPALRGVAVDTVDFTETQRLLLGRKRLTRRLYESLYRECLRVEDRFLRGVPGIRVEIGSGAGFIKDVIPDTVTTDIKALPFVDIQASADCLPFDAGSVRAILGINVFHHLPDPRSFFREALRVLNPGGGVVLVEPYYGVVARLVYGRLHRSEPYDLRAGWETDARTPMSGANPALSFIVFVRDRAHFEHEFPQFEIVLSRSHTQLLYILSGGTNFRQLVPGSFAGLVARVDLTLSPLNRFLALLQTVTLLKRTES